MRRLGVRQLLLLRGALAGQLRREAVAGAGLLRLPGAALSGQLGFVLVARVGQLRLECRVLRLHLGVDGGALGAHLLVHLGALGGDLSLQRRPLLDRLGGEFRPGGRRRRLPLGLPLGHLGGVIGRGLLGAGIQLRARLLGVGVEGRVGGDRVVLELGARVVGLALEVGAALLDVVLELGATAGVLRLELGAPLLGVAGEHGCGFPCLCDFALGDDFQLGDLALGLRTECGDLALARCTRLCDLGGDRAADGCGLACRVVCDGLGFRSSPGEERLGLLLRRRTELGDLRPRVAEQLLGVVRGVLTVLLHLMGDAGSELLGIDVGLADEPGGLLLSDPEDVLEAGAESGIGGAADLVQFGLQIFGDRLEALQLLGLVGLVRVGLDQLAPELVDRLVDVVLLVPAQFGAEARVVCRHNSLLGWILVVILGPEGGEGTLSSVAAGWREFSPGSGAHCRLAQPSPRGLPVPGGGRALVIG